MNAPAPASIPVIAIQESDLWEMKQPDFMVKPYDAIDDVTLFDIMGEIQPASVIIIESDVFQRSTILLHDFLRQIRRRKGKEPRILILRCKNLGRENTILTDGDKSAGANDILWYQLSMKQEEFTEKISAFIRNAAPSPKKEPSRKPAVAADTADIFPDAKVNPTSVPSKQSTKAVAVPPQWKKGVPPPVPKSDFPFWFSRPGMNPVRKGKNPSKKTQSDSPASAPSIDTVDSGASHLTIRILEHSLIFRKRSLAKHFSDIVKNGLTTTPFSDISRTKGGAQVQISYLRNYLNTLHPLLGECIVSDCGIGYHFSSTIFLTHMNKRGR